MGKYGDAAVNAVKLIESKKANNPKDAWESSSSKIFGAGTPGQCKGCPKGAFLGLCEEGKIKGIPLGNYTRSVKNKNYAIKAIKILKEKPTLSLNPEALWNEVIGDEVKTHNQQMDVVATLWNNDLIEI